LTDFLYIFNVFYAFLIVTANWSISTITFITLKLPKPKSSKGRAEEELGDSEPKLAKLRPMRVEMYLCIWFRPTRF